MLIEIVTNDFSQGRLARTCLAHNDGVDRKANGGNVLARAQISIGVDNSLELALHILQANQLVEYMLRYQGLSAPFTELGVVPIFLMTNFANHLSQSTIIKVSSQ
jgi:hypothetical protein